VNDEEEYGCFLSILALFIRPSNTINFLYTLHVAQLHHGSFLLFLKLKADSQKKNALKTLAMQE
jgi:hypothetical protein